jgi:hypothetical protein
MTMKTMKPLMLAALTALSLGVGTAMAQEIGGSAGPYETAQLKKMLAQQAAAATATARADAAPTGAPRYGSSDRADVNNWWGLAGRDGNNR